MVKGQASASHALTCPVSLVRRFAVAGQQAIQRAVLARLAVPESLARAMVAFDFVNLIRVREHQERAVRLHVDVGVALDDLLGLDDGRLPPAVARRLVECRLNHFPHLVLVYVQHLVYLLNL